MIQLAAALLGFVILPSSAGYALLRLLDRSPRSFWSIPALSFILGLALWTWLNWLGYLARFSLYTLGAAYVALILILYGWLLWRRKRATEENSRPNMAARRDLHSYQELTVGGIGVALSVLLIAVVFFFVGTYQDPSTDSYRHLMFIRKLVAQQRMSEDIFYLSSNVPYNLINGNYAYNSVYTLYALLSRLFSVDPARIWFRVPAFLIPVLFSAYYLLAHSLFKKWRFVIASLGFIVLYWALYGHVARVLGGPYSIGLIAYLVLIADYWRALMQEKLQLGRLAVLALCGASMLLLHTQWWAFLLITVGVLIVLLLLHRQLHTSKRVATFLGGILVCSFPLFLPRLEFYRPIAHELASVLISRKSNVLYYVANLYGYNLVKFFPHTFWVFLGLAMLVLIWSLKQKRRVTELGGGYTALMVVSVAFLLANPLTVTGITKLASATISARLVELIPIWGVVLSAFVFVSAWTAMAPWWQRLSVRVRLFLSLAASVFVGTEAMRLFVIRPLVGILAGGIQTPEFREEALNIISTRFHIPAFALTALLEYSLPVTLVGGLLVGICLVFIVWRIQGLRARRSALIGTLAPLSLVLVLLLSPGSYLSPWRYWGSDQFYAQYYGPTLTQTTQSEALGRMFDQIIEGSVVVTDGHESRNLILAFRDVKISGDVHGLVSEGRRINNFIAPVFGRETPVADVLKRILELSPDYLILSPRSSHLSWMRYDHYPEVFNKVFDETISGISYYNNRYVIYKVQLSQVERLLESMTVPVSDSATVVDAETCPMQRIKVPYLHELSPEGWVAAEDKLSDDEWCTPDASLTWAFLRDTWFYIEFNLQDIHRVEKLVVRNCHPSSSYQLHGLAVFASTDGSSYQEVGSVAFSDLDAHGEGEHSWVFEDIGADARYVRVAVYSGKKATIGEVEIYVCRD